MPSVWLPNIEEIAASGDPHYQATFVPRVKHYYPRYLYWLKPGDLLIADGEIEEDFARYVAGLSGLTPDLDWILRPQGEVTPFTLAGTVLNDQALLECLRRLAETGTYTLESYIESPRMVELSRASGIPTRQTQPQKVEEGLINRLNDKGYFKTLSQEVGVQAIPAKIGNSVPEIQEMVRVIGQSGNVVVKKVLHGGGLGNLAGSPEELVAVIPSWYHQGPVVVEPFLDFKEIIGSLVWLDESGASYLGTDVQIAENGKWRGFRYPHPEPEIRRHIEAQSMRYAAALHRMGTRGYLNLDWGVTEEGILALEANVRHNGFGHILDYARRYFGEQGLRKHILYIEGVTVRAGLGTREVIETLSAIQVEGESLLIQGPGASRGSMLVMPPENGACALAFFGEEDDYLAKARRLAEEALA